jgi:hypothetical protein
MARRRLIRDIIGFIRNIIMRRFHSDQATPRQPTAHHEAGHAVAAVAFGIRFDYVDWPAPFTSISRLTCFSPLFSCTPSPYHNGVPQEIASGG